MPPWLRGDVLDVRKVLLYHLNQESAATNPAPITRGPKVCEADFIIILIEVKC